MLCVVNTRIQERCRSITYVNILHTDLYKPVFLYTRGVQILHIMGGIYLQTDSNPSSQQGEYKKVDTFYRYQCRWYPPRVQIKTTEACVPWEPVFCYFLRGNDLLPVASCYFTT